MYELYSHQPNTYSYKEVNSYIHHTEFCTCVEKVTITLIRRWDFRINNLYTST